MMMMMMMMMTEKTMEWKETLKQMDSMRRWPCEEPTVRQKKPQRESKRKPKTNLQSSELKWRRKKRGKLFWFPWEKEMV